MSKKVLIIGWYGTETAGDKAILDTIIKKKQDEGKVVAVASMYPFITEYTLLELGIKQVKVVSLYDPKVLLSLFFYSEVIIGGGPLMHIKEIHIIKNYFRLAKFLGVKRVVYGCGIGPFNNSPLELNALNEIINCADEIFVRDSDAKQWIDRNTNNIGCVVINDPAVEYVISTDKNLSDVKKRKKVVFCLRNWPKDYSTLDEKKYNDRLKKFNSEIIKTVSFLEDSGYEVKMLPMHCWYVGDDDRDYYLDLMKDYYKNDYQKYLGLDKLYSTYEIIKEMKEAELCVCMRFHSVLFAETIGANYCAIDYTEKGKIYSFLEDRNRLGNYLALEDYDSVCIKEMIN